MLSIDLSGRAVLVTGGARGVGRGIVTRFLDAGAEVLFCGRNEPDSLPASGGREAHFVSADVRDVDDVARLVDSARERFGRLDAVVNNAGGSPPADSATVSPRFNEAIVRLNLLDQACHSVLPAMDNETGNVNASGGRIAPEQGASGHAHGYTPGGPKIISS